MIKAILLFSILTISLVASIIKVPILSVDLENDLVTVQLKKIDVGITGFAVHGVSDKNSIILKNLEVIGFDINTKIATLKMTEFNELSQDSLPHGKWKVEVGDSAILAYGYSRALLIAPNEEIYYRVTKATQSIHWVHPDLFATVLSFNGHPTPLKEDFNNMRNTASVGLLFFFLNQKLYTVDAKSLKLINISEAVLKQDSIELPFYTRVEEIDANWWGEGSGELDEYESYYFGLLIENNPNNATLKKLYSQYQTQR